MPNTSSKEPGRCNEACTTMKKVVGAGAACHAVQLRTGSYSREPRDAADCASALRRNIRRLAALFCDAACVVPSSVWPAHSTVRCSYTGRIRVSYWTHSGSLKRRCPRTSPR
uniref:Uncharacterized protein n=1 Tax=Mycena chlorophos TaxID=658473 RepID=A0ABQ0L357_MYCCL|nr:predicted protein [Mycena chlorophos]